MWPGASSPGVPAGPPPQTAAPIRTTAPIRPAAGWYVLPGALTLVAVVGLVVFVILNFGSLRVSDDPEATGSAAAGARIYLVEGHRYFVYVEDSAAKPTSCGVAAADGSGSVALKNSWSAPTTESVAGRSYRYTGSFMSPATGTAIVNCQGVDGELMVKPDGTVLGMLGLLMFVAGGLMLLAFIIFLIIILRRSGAKRAALAASRPFKGPYG
ncbi:hypothetical protein [Actinomadura alba]|uniref:Uncharacterized protein n=1 Tax=Actinomadura alba TaxID=406431 RepID=A0ABR7LK54_9ACTN|nr:hypothetical protein [Actinomadura alba]MBC6465256.1 hypothetical protein [Actinomadura alba]